MKLKKFKLAMAIIPQDKHKKEDGARFQEPRVWFEFEWSVTLRGFILSSMQHLRESRA